ncbi:MAG TPA: 30S ribosomal protein S6 [Dehalococcoidia bacterium]|nr:30S ribosomal protein S6 [Dehalococcoidia bacterium]
MREYELVFMIRPEVTDDELPGVVDRVKQIVADCGGTIARLTSWGRRKLAYPIANALEATYMLAHLQLEPSTALKLEANLRLADDVLRHLLVRSEGWGQVTAIPSSGEESKESSHGQSE